jgi:hypothetical protein
MVDGEQNEQDLSHPLTLADRIARAASSPSPRPPPAFSASPVALDSEPVSVSFVQEEREFHAERIPFAAASENGGMSAPMPLVAPASDDAETARIDEPAAPPEPVPLAVAPASQATDAQPEPEPGFVRQARRRAFWRSPAVRAVMSLMALLLSLLLAGQWALHERDLLAARYPALKPWLEQLCEPLGCRVEPARRIDAIVIDSTALVRRQGNTYSFDLVLKNTAPMALAMPALELSLTNTRDDVIARRVFRPEELPDVPALLPAESSVAISLRLSLAVGEALPMAGYRALVFYP